MMTNETSTKEPCSSLSTTLCHLNLQVNNGAAAVLYALAGDWVQAAGRVQLLDVCCGTGTIGLSLAHRVHSVVGVEMVEQAVQDAKTNAADNGITNCQFVCGKAEDVLPGMLGGEGSLLDAEAELVAVVDPPRAGLHPKVLKVRRVDEFIRVVDVSLTTRRCCGVHGSSVWCTCRAIRRAWLPTARCCVGQPRVGVTPRTIGCRLCRKRVWLWTCFPTPSTARRCSCWSVIDSAK